MSIMYEALQQTQTNNETQSMLSSQDNMTRDDWIDVGISLMIAFLLALIIVAHYPQFNSKSNNIFKPAETTVAGTLPAEIPKIVPVAVVDPVVNKGIDKEDYKLKYVLNGVFVSEDEKIAMVNNRFFNIGDDIDGMKVVSIEPDNIKLENTSGIIELHLAV